MKIDVPATAWYTGQCMKLYVSIKCTYTFRNYILFVMWVCLNMKTLLGFRYRRGFLKSYICSETNDEIRVRRRNEFIGFVISPNLIINIYVNEWCLIEFDVRGSLQSLLFSCLFNVLNKKDTRARYENPLSSF